MKGGEEEEVRGKLQVRRFNDTVNSIYIIIITIIIIVTIMTIL